MSDIDIEEVKKFQAICGTNQRIECLNIEGAVQHTWNFDCSA